MTTTAQHKPARDAGAFVTTAALLLLIVTAVRLLSIDIDRWRTVQRLRERTTAVFPVGSLLGVTTDRAAWADDGKLDKLLVLFPIAAATAPSEIAFWRAVALASPRRPQVQFVGVCDNGDRCSVPPGDPAITTLSFMDPYQMYMVAIARREGRALLYRGPELVTALAVGQDQRAVAAEITRHARQIANPTQKGATP